MPSIPSSSFTQDFFPVAATVAIAIFIAREVLEWRRRKAAEARKLQAMKLILSRECELNLWPVTCLINIFRGEPIMNESGRFSFVRVEVRASGPGVRMRDPEGFEIVESIGALHRDVISKLLLESAAVHDELFKVVSDAHDALSEAEHIRESLIHLHETERETGIESMFDRLAGYALKELVEVEEALKTLYRFCTGKELERARLR